MPILVYIHIIIFGYHFKVWFIPPSQVIVSRNIVYNLPNQFIQGKLLNGTNIPDTGLTITFEHRGILPY